MLPSSSAADYDLRLHDDPVTASNGFDMYLENSSWAAGYSDFVLVNGNNSGGSAGTRQAGVVNWNNSTVNFAVEQSNRVAMIVAPDTLVSQSLGSYDVLNVYELWVAPDELTSYTFELDQTAGTANLAFALYDEAGTTYQKSDYVWYRDSSGDGGDEAQTFEFTESGYYGLVVFKRGYSDYGKASAYTLRIGKTPPNLTPFAATGWDYPVVARNDNTAVHGDAHVSTILNGNTYNTYFSQCGINDGPNPAALNNTRYYLDGVYAWWVNYVTINAGQVYFACGSGPMIIRGGRHTIEWRNDWDDQVAELNELDNAYAHQFVWSPMVLGDEAAIARSAPPDRGTMPLPNSDGFVHAGANDYAWVTATCPDNAADDYDLIVYEDYGGAQSGFSVPWIQSGLSGGVVDYGGGAAATTGVKRYPACVEFSGGAAGYTMDAAGSYPGRYATATPVVWTGETLPAGRLVDVFEAELLAGEGYKVKANNVSGGADLVVDIHPPSTPFLNWATAEASLDAGGPGDTELALFSPAEDGRYVFVVHKKGATDKPLTTVYDFTIAYGSTGVDEQEIPDAFALRRNAPNPFNPMTVIKYELPVGGHPVRLEIFAISGQRIRTLVSEIQSAGYHETIWNGKNDAGEQVASGMYFYRLRAGEFQRTEKMTLIK